MTLDVWLAHSEPVDATTHDLDGLVDGAAHAVVDAGLGDVDRDLAVAALLHGERGLAAGACDAAGDLRERANLGHDLGAVGGVVDADLNAARRPADAARERDALLAQHAAHVVAQIVDLLLEHVGGVHLQHQMRPALQIEAQHDLAEGNRRH